MAIFTTAGGSGTTSTSLNQAGTMLTLFTTPNTTNGIFLVNINVAGSTAGSGAFGVAYPQTVTDMKVGPNTTVYCPVWNNLALAKTYYVTWKWCSLVNNNVTIATAGGSGTTTQALNDAGANVSLFTTPNTTDAEFHVSVLIAGSTIGSGGYETAFSTMSLNMKVGPNTAVSAPVWNNVTTNYTYYIAWHWLSTVL